jgi:hypothetical protein
LQRAATNFRNPIPFFGLPFPFFAFFASRQPFPG